MSAKEPAQAVALHRFRLTQEGVVSLIALTLFVVFALFLNNFLTQGNLLTLLKNVAILGTLLSAWASWWSGAAST